MKIFRRSTQLSSAVYHCNIHGDLHINGPVTFFNQPTTSSHCNNTTTTTIKDVLNDNLTSVMDSDAEDHNIKKCSEENFSGGEGADIPTSLPMFPGTSFCTVQFIKYFSHSLDISRSF